MEIHGAVELGRLITETNFEKLDFFGDDYLTQRVYEEHEKHCKERNYRNYVTKALELIALNTANIAAGERQGFPMPCAFSDLSEPNKGRQTTQNEQSPQEIKKKFHERFKKLGGGRSGSV